jgi:hypothetical protein
VHVTVHYKGREYVDTHSPTAPSSELHHFFFFFFFEKPTLGAQRLCLLPVFMRLSHHSFASRRVPGSGHGLWLSRIPLFFFALLSALLVLGHAATPKETSNLLFSGMEYVMKIPEYLSQFN